MDDDTPSQQDPQAADKVTTPEPGDALAVAGAALADALGHMLRLAVRRGRQEMSRAASQGRIRMELRQLRRDRQRMFEKLGREVVHLVDAGELTHPGMVRGAERIRQVDAQIERVEAELRQAGGTDEKEVAPDGDVE